MKKLTYSIALVSLVMAMASCTKNGDLQPIAVPNTTKSVIPAVCDSTQLVSIALNNLTEVGSYTILFYGSTNYDFSIPGGANKTVAIKPGLYSITIYAPGNISEYNDYVQYSSYRLLIKQSGAKIDNVYIAPCAGPQSLGIVE
jgi:hypothetical protein